MPQEPKKENESEDEYKIRTVAKQMALTSYMTENRLFGPYRFTDDEGQHIVKINDIKIVSYTVLNKSTIATQLVEQRLEDPESIPYFRVFADVVEHKHEAIWTNTGIIVTDLEEYYAEKHPLIHTIPYNKIDLEIIREAAHEKYEDQF
jgi:hypothetical protein